MEASSIRVAVQKKPLAEKARLRRLAIRSAPSSVCSSGMAGSLPRAESGSCPQALTGTASRLGTVLFVSDDDYFRSTMRAYLEHLDFVVRSCADAARVPELFFRGPRVDLLLMDVHAMGATGLRLAAELTGFEPQLPVIVIAAPDLEKNALASIARRGWKFLSKPVLLPELLGLIYNALEPGKRLRHSSQSAQTAAAADLSASFPGRAAVEKTPPALKTSLRLMKVQGAVQ